jgi:hypothetical protein
MNSNGFTKRNVFIGDVQISEDLTCGDMVCQEMTLTGDINLDNKDIVGVNNLEVKTVNGGAILTNPLTSDLDCDGKNILNVGDLEVTTINNRSVLYTPSIGNLNMNNFNINNVNNINATTLNSKTPFYQTTTVDLDMNNNAINNVSIVNFPTGQYIDGQDGSALNLYTEGDITLACSQVVIGDNIATNYTLPTVRGADNSIMTLGVDGASSWSDTLVNQVGTLQTKTQYQSVNTSTGTTNFTGIVNPSLTLSIGNSQPNQVGYSLPTSRPLAQGYVMVTPNASGNTLQFVVPADPNKIQYLTASGNVSTFTGGLTVTGLTSTASLSIGTAPNNYSMPTVRGLTTQYLGSNGTNAVWNTFGSPTYAQIARQGAIETVGYTMVADVLRSASNLGGTVNSSFLSSADITVSVPNGTITYTGPQRVLSIECSCRARIGDAKQANDLVSLYLTIDGTTVSLDSNQVSDTTTRTWLYCKYIQPVNTGAVISFSISYAKNVNTNLFLSGISLNVNAYSF